MKSLFTLLVIFISAGAIAQTVFPVNEGGEIEYKEVVQADSASAKELRLRSKICLTNMFNSFKDVVQNDDAESNVLMIKGNLSVWVPYLLTGYDVHVHFSLNIEFKEARYRYTINIGKYTIYHSQAGVQGTGMISNNEKSPDGMHLTPPMWRDLKAKTDSQVLALIGNIKECMKKTTKSDDW